MTASPVPQDLIALSHRLADASGEVIRRYYRAKFDIETKSDQSPVTIADKQAEEAIRVILEKERPRDGIWGEEGGRGDINSEFLWVIDPIDGTKAFATGRPLFGTLIGLYRGEDAVLGVIDQPVTKERWLGANGGAMLNGTTIRCRPCATLKAANIATTGPDLFDAGGQEKFTRIARASSFAVYGGDCYSYGQLACGFLDAVIEERMNLHDFAALIPVVEGAGGKITGWDGKPLGRKEKSPVLACGDARLHDELRGMLAG